MDLEKALLRTANPNLQAKTPYTNYYCPLCRAERKFRYKSKLSVMNYVQIIFLSVLIGYLLFPVMKAKVVFMFFIVWMLFETINKFLFRKEIPCPDCGFDATWYKKDVKVARKKVEDFWKQIEAQKRAAEVQQQEQKISVNDFAMRGEEPTSEYTQQL